ncbi:MAG: AIR carboxylase family protein, partial [Candidatus Limnocylindria bacterium]
MSARVAIVMGSASDREVMQVAAQTLDGLGVETEVRVLSAHRTPDALHAWARGLEAKGVKVVIAGAGGAAHLAGAVAAVTT